MQSTVYESCLEHGLQVHSSALPGRCLACARLEMGFDVDYEPLAEIVREFPRAAFARRVLDGLSMDPACLGGRILPPDLTCSGWRLQAFFEATCVGSERLGVVARRVMVSESSRRSLGISPQVIGGHIRPMGVWA